MSSPCPAMPMTRVAKMSGVISDLIIRRKMVESGLSCCEDSGNAHPTSTPMTIATMIHCVSERLRRKVSMNHAERTEDREQRTELRQESHHCLGSVLCLLTSVFCP